MRNITSPNGYLYSVYPCTVGLTFSPWIYMVPQYRPNSVLILGYGGGTTAGLIKMIYGDVPITGVDVDFYENPYAVEFIKEDAEEYVKKNNPVDVIVIDLWVDYELADCVTKKSFVDDLNCNYIIVHVPKDTNMGVYGTPYKVINYDEHKIYYFVKQRIPAMKCLGL